MLRQPPETCQHRSGLWRRLGFHVTSVWDSILKSVGKFWVKRWLNHELVVPITVQIMCELTTGTLQR